MAKRRRPKPRARFEDLLSQLAPSVRAAFIEAVRNLRTGVQFRAVVRAMEIGDLDAAIEAMNLEPAAMQSLYEAIVAAYTKAGAAAADDILPKYTGGVRIRFDATAPEAEEYIRRRALNKVRGLSDDIKMQIRGILAESLSRGDNPTRAVQSIVGRYNKFTGQREGGLLGLTGDQMQWLDNARNELEELSTRYFTRRRRDKRYDPMVRKAIKTGESLTKNQIDVIIARYSDRFLTMRAGTLALNETIAALNNTRIEAWRQASRKRGAISLDFVEKIWHSTADAKVRDSHQSLNGQVVPFKSKFHASSGYDLAYPHDPNAPASETANCRCWMEIRVDYQRALLV